MPDEQCPICSSLLRENPRIHQHYDAKIFDCPQCGKYILEELADVNGDLHNSKQLISAWIRRENKRGEPPFIGVGFFEEDWFKNLHNMGFPQTVTEKLDKLLITYGQMWTLRRYHLIMKG